LYPERGGTISLTHFSSGMCANLDKRFNGHAAGGIGTFEALETLVLGIREKLAL
jgi:hypothetical protein